MGKSFSRLEEDKMSNDFENSQEYRKALEIAKKQQELYKNVTKAISPEALAKFQELSDKLNEWKNSLNNMPGLLKFAEMLKNYQREVRETEGLTEAEFEEKYPSKIHDLTIGYFGKTGGSEERGNSTNEGLGEIVAETMAIISTPGLNHKAVSTRTHYLMMHFPKTIACAANLIEEKCASCFENFN